MTDIRTIFGDTKFDTRACGLLKREGKLLVSTEVDGTQTLSGGAIKIGETSEITVVREFKEETNLNVQVEKLVAIVENFFNFEGKPYQQIIFVYELSLADEESEIMCREKVNVSWVEKEKVNMLQPIVLNDIVQYNGDKIQHIINRDA